MAEKTITMSLHEYEMIALENESYKRQFEELKQEKMVYVTIEDRRIDPWRLNKMSGRMVEKDELLKRMQIHLEAVEKRMRECETNDKRRINSLIDDLYQSSKKPWWKKLF